MSTRCLASRGHAGRMLVLCHLPVVVFIAGFVQHVTAARQVQPGLLTDLTHPNRCTDVYWYALNLVVMQVPSCLLSALLLLHAQGLCNMSTQAGCRSATDPTHQNNRAREL
jgi:hypothetical protein